MTDTKNSARQEWLSVPRRREEERLDPHVYKRGVNGLTVEEAVRRAAPRVVAILERSEERPLQPWAVLPEHQRAAVAKATGE